jgi:hypothetical protein
MESVERFEDELAGAFAIEGKNSCSVGAEHGAESAGGFDREGKAVDALAGDGARNGSVGGDENGFRFEADRQEERHGIRLASAGGDDDFDAGGFGVAERANCARGNEGSGRGQQRAVDVDDDHPNGKRHVPPV